METSKWDTRYLNLAKEVSAWSEDKNKKVGSVIVRDNRVLSIGYNGLPTGVKLTLERQEKPEKYHWFEHAERNSIYTAARLGHSLEGSKIYITHLPCTDCARAIVQSGINEVISIEPNPESSWYNTILKSIQMLKEVGIIIKFLKNDL